jgi:hypothetical protein
MLPLNVGRVIVDFNSTVGAIDFFSGGGICAPDPTTIGTEETTFNDYTVTTKGENVRYV